MFQKQSVVLLPLSLTVTQMEQAINTMTWCYTPAKEKCVLQTVGLQRPSVVWQIESGMRRICHAKVMSHWRAFDTHTVIVTYA